MEIIIASRATRYLKPVIVPMLTVVLASCEGDIRSLEEQVEAVDLDLASIDVALPPNSIIPFFIASDQPVQLAIVGTNFNGDNLSLSSENRRWSSSNSDIVSITDDGVATGLAEGDATISVRVAGTVAVDALTINVSNAPIQSITQITSSADTAANTAPMLDPCLPASFSAIGNFGIGDNRALSNVFWSIDEASELADAEVFTTGATLAGGTELVGRTPTGELAGPITLTATVPANEETGSASVSGTRTVEVADSLVSLSVEPANVTILEDRTLRLTAPAQYSTALNAFATNGVSWEVTRGAGVASVGTVGGTPGQVTALDIGTATVTAECGAFSDSAIVVVAAGSDDLAFSREADIIIELSDPEFNDLRVSQGEDFDANNEVSGEAEWASSNTDVVTVDNTGDDRGDLLAVGVGTASITAEFEGARISITVEVR